MKPEPLNDCGCCEGVKAETPAPIENRPGLRAIAYRCGTHAQFKQAMLAGLSSETRPELVGLSTRDDDDFSIALLDAWATTADVLSFYQERIAQESYLRTANERGSLLELGRLIGYELRPGVAASTYLAFTLETAAGSPRVVTLDIGTKAQSVPGPDEKPQIFETVEKIEARPEWNEIVPQLTLPQQIDASTAAVYLKGTATNLRKGDNLLFLAAEVGGQRTWDVCRVEAATGDFQQDRTRVVLTDKPAHFSAAASSTVQVFALRQRAALFGYNAPDPRVLAEQTRDNYKDVSTAISTIGSGLGAGSASIVGAAGLGDVVFTLRKIPDWVFKIFGNAIELDAAYAGIVPGSWVVLRAGSKRLLCRVDQAVEVSRTDYTLTGKVTSLTLTAIASADSASLASFGDVLRGTLVLGESQELAFADAPIEEPVAGTTWTVSSNLDELPPGRALAISGKDAASGAAVSRIVTLVDAEPVAGGTKVQIAPAVPALERTSVRLNANVAVATHGESVSEILGSGDASQPFQRFVLKQPPLTYVRAANAAGSRSSLQVRVNDLLWHEVPTFYGRGPTDRVFVLRTDDDGTTSVRFGDGVTGARLPTGTDNVRAWYRRGLGVEGLVKTDQLSLLLSRPLGLKGVTNPVDAEGAADREQLVDARRNAPLTVMTLDRIVTLQDYEDFVRAFAGVAKAFATWTWDGEQRGVFVTVAGPMGAEVELSGDFGKTLSSAVRHASVPGVGVRVQSYRRTVGLFTVSARVKVDPDYDAASVLSAVRLALENRFSFDERAFGQPVDLSEVIAVIHSVRGVVAVDVDELRRLELPPSIVPPLTRRWTPKLLQLATRRVAIFKGAELFARPSALFKPLPPKPPPRLNARLVAAVPQAGTKTGVAPAELLVLAPLAAEQMSLMP